MTSLLLALTFAGCSMQSDDTIHTSSPVTDPVAVVSAEPEAEPVRQPRYNHQVFGSPCDPFAALPDDQKVWRVVEIDYPKGPGHVITPVTFDDIVNPEVVKRTMAVYGCTNHMHDQRDVAASVLGLGLGHDLSIEGLSYFARTMAYVNLGLDSLGETDGPAYFASGDVARDIVRDYLKNPQNLKEVYRGYKSTLLEGVNKAQAPEPIRVYLNTVVIPYFTKPVPENVLEAERMLLAAEAKCVGLDWEKGGKECYDNEQAARNALIALTPDHRVLQWMLRRKTEGGDPLVQAWGEVLVDFSNSL